jgi:AcrR family transcriptional regulator
VDDDSVTNARPRRKTRRRKTRKQGRYHHGNLRRALLDAALMLVEREGPKGVSLRSVARLAGVSPAAPYRHFPGKEGLLASVAEEGFNAMTAAMEAAVEANKELPLAGFRSVTFSYVKFAAVHPSHFRVMFGPEISDHSRYPGLKESSERSLALLTRMIRSCQRPDLIGGVEPRELAVAAWSTLHGLATLLVDDQLGQPLSTDAELQALTDRVADVLYRGLSYSGL